VPPFVVPPLGGSPLKGELQTTIVWVAEALHRQRLELLDKRHDKDYSVCDAVSFIVMRQRGLAEALTTDHHFAQKGFQQLLRG
jgi:predicted nucleic acid-binding protein